MRNCSPPHRNSLTTGTPQPLPGMQSIPYTSLLCLQGYLDSLSCFASYRKREAEAGMLPAIFKMISSADTTHGMSIFSFFYLKFISSAGILDPETGVHQRKPVLTTSSLQ